MWADGRARENNFDLLRLAMALLVVLSHSFTLVSGTVHDSEPLRRLTGGAMSLGDVAVDVFFLLSGYLITMSWEKCPRAGSFLWRRASRIYPGLAAATAVCAFVVSPWAVAGWTAAGAGREAVVAAVGLQRFTTDWAGQAFPNNPYPGEINGTTWTLIYEAACYLLVLALGVTGALASRRGVLMLLAAAYAGVAAGWRFPALGLPGHPVLYGEWGRLVVFFLTGSAFYLYRREIPAKGWLAAAGCAVVAAGLWWQVLLPAALPVGLGYVTFWLAFQPYVRVARFARWGDCSYGTYLYGFMVQQWLVSLAPGWWTSARLFGVAAPAAVLAGALSWHLVEKRCLVRGNAGPAAAAAVGAEVAAAGG
jgi:peptidoglycan/LPS O-acetylase OafA/YrhL